MGQKLPHLTMIAGLSAISHFVMFTTEWVRTFAPARALAVISGAVDGGYEIGFDLSVAVLLVYGVPRLLKVSIWTLSLVIKLLRGLLGLCERGGRAYDALWERGRRGSIKLLQDLIAKLSGQVDEIQTPAPESNVESSL